MIEVDAAVVGAGISGLVVAHRLKQTGHTVVCLDPNSPGGVISSRFEGGFLTERGPNSTLETCPEITKLIAELDLGSERIYASDRAKRRFILRRKRLYDLPMSPISFLSTGLFSMRAKARLALEPFIGKGKPGESLADFVKRRLGQEFLDYAINPFVAGVYAGNPHLLSVAAGFPKLYALERDYGGLIMGALRGARARKKRAEVAKDRARMLSFKRGMGALPERLGAMLGADWIEDRVISLARNPGGYRLQTAGEKALHARVLVLAVPAMTAANLLDDLDLDAANALREIHYPPVTSVALGFKREQVAHTLDGFGFLVPEKEKRMILGSLFSSGLFPGRAPEGHVLLTTFVGGTRQPALTDQTDEQVASMVCQELSEILGINGDPVYRSVTAWTHAIPQYDLQHLQRIERLSTLESDNPGMYLRANYRDGISVGDCIKAAEATASQIMGYLRDF